MDPSKDNPHRLENFQAHRHARELAVHTFQLLDRSSLREDNGLGGALAEAVLTLSGRLASSHALPADLPEKSAAQREALGACARLESLLLVARDLKAVGERDCAQLEERLKTTRMLIHGLLRAQARDRSALRPASPGPSRRPPSSGGGSRGDAPWGNRS